MKILTTHREELSKNLTSVKKFLYSSPQSGASLWQIAQKYSVSDDTLYTKFALTVGDIILGFYRVEDTVPLLQQELGIEPRAAALLGADVLKFLAPLSDPNWQPPESEKNYNEKDDNYTSPTEPIASIPNQSQPTPTKNNQSTTLDTLPRTPPLRTMAGDMAHPAEHHQTEHHGGLVGGLNYEPIYTSLPGNLHHSLSDTPIYTSHIPTKTNPTKKQSLEEPPHWRSEQ